jgi:hypothetical protein
VTAGAFLAAREANTDRAHQPVLVKMQDDAGAGLARGG